MLCSENIIGLYDIQKQKIVKYISNLFKPSTNTVYKGAIRFIDCELQLDPMFLKSSDSSISTSVLG